MTLHDPTADDRGPEAPSATAAALPIELGVANFEREALVRSRELPVLIDFWATWCAPCKTLGPILDQLAVKHAGRFVLAKVDIDREPDLAEAFRIQSVPTVVLLVDGRPVDAFMGVQSEKAVETFLAPHLGPPPASIHDQVAELTAAGRQDEALTRLVAWTSQHPEDGQALIALARMYVEMGEQEAASSLREELSAEDLQSDAGRALVALLGFQSSAGDLASLAAAAQAAPEDIAAQLTYGKALVAAGSYDEGLEVLWQAARRDLAFDGGAPRTALIEVFSLLGFEDARTLEYQRRLSMLLTA